MTDVPVISITLDETDDRDEGDDDSRRPSINDCHTDVEDLDSDQSRKNSLFDGMKGRGGVTDVEDFDDSGDNDDASEPNYGPEISLNEYLDQGVVDESSNVTGNQRNKLGRMQSLTKSASPTAFSLAVTQDYGGVTDCEDLEASGDENDEGDKVYSDEDRAIVLEDSNAVDIHDSVNARKKCEKFTPKVFRADSSGHTSSESEDEKPMKARLKAHKFTKRVHRIDDAKSDTENIFFSDDDTIRRCRKTTPVLETPDVEFMAFDGSDNDDAADQPPQYPEINISFVAEEKPKPKPKTKKKSKQRSVPASSSMLVLPIKEDEGHTDVENLNSSDDDDEPIVKNKQKSFIPIAVARSDALTDVEDFGEASDDDCSFDEKPDVPLPSPTRELTFLVENKTGEPMKQTTPLPDNMLLGFHDLDADKGLTDVEDFSDESDDNNENEEPDYSIECIPDLDGGVVLSSDHAGANMSPRPSMTPDPLTDCEDIFMKRQDKGSECRRRRTKPKHSQHKPKSNFLDTKLYVEASFAGAHTDVEDLDVDDDDVLLKDRSLKQRRATVDNASKRKPSTSSNADGKTDVEYVSGDDSIDLPRFSPDARASLSDFQIDTCTLTSFRDSVDRKSNSLAELKLPQITRFSPSPDNFNVSTDIEDHQCQSEYEDAVSYSRAQTATPNCLSRDLEELSTSEIHEIHSGAFNRFEIKDNLCLNDSLTDVENFDEN